MQTRRRTPQMSGQFWLAGHLKAFSSSNRHYSVEGTSYIFLAHLDRDDHWGPICVVWMVGPAKKPVFEKAMKTPIDLTRTRRHVWSRGAAASPDLTRPVSGVLRCPHFEVGGFRLLRQQHIHPFYAQGPRFRSSIWQGDRRFFPLDLWNRDLQSCGPAEK